MEKKIQKPIIEEIPAPYRFTDGEKLDIGKKLATTYQDLASTEDMKKQVISDFKAKADRLQAEANSLQQKILSGFEYRNTRCLVTLIPKEGKKEYHNDITGEFIERREMNKSDYEMTLPFADEKTDSKLPNPVIPPPAEDFTNTSDAPPAIDEQWPVRIVDKPAAPSDTAPASDDAPEQPRIVSADEQQPATTKAGKKRGAK